MGNQPSNTNQPRQPDAMSELQQQILQNQVEIQRIQIENMRKHNATAFNHPILSNPNLHQDIAQNPQMKAQFLRFILSEFKGQMTNPQITRINQMLMKLPVQRNNMSMPLMPQPVKPQITQEQNKISILQNNRAGIMSRSYETDTEKEKREFELEQQKQKDAFIIAQEQRKREYTAKLAQLKNQNIDAMKLFGLQKGFDLRELKSAYNRLALKTHPNQRAGSQEKFELVTKCYFMLIEDLKKQEQDKQYMDLRKGSHEYIEKQVDETKRFKGTIGKDDFNINKFNNIFEENKIYDPTEEGYEDWFRNDGNKSTDTPKIFSDKFNINVFNNTFHEHAVKNESRQVVEFKEPQAIVSAEGMSFTELGGVHSGDFGKNNQYCDLKQAYTSHNTFVDSTIKPRKSYKNIQEYEMERSNITHEMTPEQHEEYQERQKMEEYAEQDRLERLRRHDNMTAEQYSKIHKALVGYSAQPDLKR